MIEDRFKTTKRAGMLGIIGNIFLLLIKALVGFISNSQAMIADSVNSREFDTCIITKLI